MVPRSFYIFNIDFERELKMNQDYKEMYKRLQTELDEEREKSMRLNFENSDLKNSLSDKSSEIERLEKNIETKDAKLRKLLIEKESVCYFHLH